MIRKFNLPLNGLFTLGLILPTTYLAIIPSFYFTTWEKIISSILSGGPTILIFIAGLVKLPLYLSALATRRGRVASPKLINAIVFIQLGVGLTIVSLMLSSVLIQVPARDSAMRAYFAFLMTEFLALPLLGSLYLQDTVRNRKVDMTISLLLSVGMYLCMTFMVASNLVEANPVGGGVQSMTPLEAGGARIATLLILIAASVGSPLFWQTTGLYAVDTAPPPIWIGGLYVLTLGFFLYYHNRTADEPNHSLPNRPIQLFDTLRIASTILVATLLAYVISISADTWITQNVAGRTIQLFFILLPLLAAYRLVTRDRMGNR